jgi:hypothetical protein
VWRLIVVGAWQVPEVTLSEGQDALGLGGALLFCWGVADLVFDIGLCLTLFSCQRWWLFGCCVTTLLATGATSCFLGFRVLRIVANSRPDARQWLLDHGKAVTLVVLASSSRFESLATLRLRICGFSVCMLPMEHRHFHFIRQAGMFHYLIEDLPHALVGIAQLHAQDDCDPSGGKWLPESISEKTVTQISVAFSLLSIIAGMLYHSVQLLAINAIGAGPLRQSLLGSETAAGGSTTRRTEIGGAE